MKGTAPKAELGEGGGELLQVREQRRVAVPDGYQVLGRYMGLIQLIRDKYFGLVEAVLVRSTSGEVDFEEVAIAKAFINMLDGDPRRSLMSGYLYHRALLPLPTC